MKLNVQTKRNSTNLKTKNKSLRKSKTISQAKQNHSKKSGVAAALCRVGRRLSGRGLRD
jgi:hypothetical protein